MPSIRRGKIVGEENAFIREKKRERKNAVHKTVVSREILLFGNSILKLGKGITLEGWTYRDQEYLFF